MPKVGIFYHLDGLAFNLKNNINMFIGHYYVKQKTSRKDCTFRWGGWEGAKTEPTPGEDTTQG